MNKVLLNITETWNLDFINFTESSDEIFLIPKSLDDDFENYLLEYPENRNKTFRRNHYKILTNIITNRNNLTSICNNVKQHIAINEHRFYVFLNKEKGNLFYTKTYELIDNNEKEVVLIILKSKSIKEHNLDICISDSVLNNPFYIETLKESTIYTQDALKANIDFLLSENLKKPIDKRLPNNKLISKIITVFNNILEFNSKRFSKTGNKVNRQYSSFARQSSVTRKFIQYHGRYFYSLDLRAALPSLFCILLEKNDYKIDEEYRTECKDIYEIIMTVANVNGYEYEELAEINEITGKAKVYKTNDIDADGKNIYKVLMKKFYFNNREDVKELVYRSVYFYQKTENQSITAKLFKNLWPITFDSLQCFSKKLKKETKDKSGNQEITLASLAQNLEAFIMFHDLPNCPFFTVHDQIYVLDKNEGILFRNRINEKYKDYVKLEWHEEDNEKGNKDIQISNPDFKQCESIVSEFDVEQSKKYNKVDINDFIQLYEEYSATYKDKSKLKAKICHKLGGSSYSNFYKLKQKSQSESKLKKGEMTYNKFKHYKSLGYFRKDIISRMDISDAYYYNLKNRYKAEKEELSITLN